MRVIPGSTPGVGNDFMIKMDRPDQKIEADKEHMKGKPKIVLFWVKNELAYWGSVLQWQN